LFDEECSKSVDQRKQDKLKWWQDQSEVNKHNLSDLKRDARKHFRKRGRESMKDKVNETVRISTS
jgi:hypothetical protein